MTIYGEGIIANPYNSTNFACTRMTSAVIMVLNFSFMHTHGPDAPVPIAVATKLEYDTQTHMLNIVVVHVTNIT